MADNDVLLALGVGAALALGAYAAYRVAQRPTSQGGSSDPALVQHNVVRDEHGRIRQVETFRGLNGVGGGQVPEANPQQAQPMTPATYE